MFVCSFRLCSECSLCIDSLSLGKDGIHALTTWRNDLNRALESKLGQYSQAPAMVEPTMNNRRNTVYGFQGELVANSGSHLNVVEEAEELLRPASPIVFAPSERPVSTHTFGPGSLPLPSDVREDRASSRQSRNSLATLISALDNELRQPLPPPSAASEVTLFDLESFDPEADGAASSTPHESQRTKPKSKPRHVPPVPQLRDEVKQGRRSSIRYIVSDENAPESPKVEISGSSSTGRGLAQWSARAIRPLVPKSPGKGKSGKGKKEGASQEV